MKEVKRGTLLGLYDHLDLEPMWEEGRQVDVRRGRYGATMTYFPFPSLLIHYLLSFPPFWCVLSIPLFIMHILFLVCWCAVTQALRHSCTLTWWCLLAPMSPTMDMKRRNTPHAMIVDTRDSEVTMEFTFATAATPIMMKATTCAREMRPSDGDQWHSLQLYFTISFTIIIYGFFLFYHYYLLSYFSLMLPILLFVMFILTSDEMSRKKIIK